MDKLWHPPDTPWKLHDASYPFISPEKHRHKLQGRVVLVVGASRGIGRATALAFAAAGAKVACVARTEHELDSLVRDIQSAHQTEAIAVPGDVTDVTLGRRVLVETETRLGPVDILINNAGISRISDLEHATDVHADWKVIETNMLGSLSFVHAVVPSMIARKQGIIINVVSIIGQINLPYFSAYAASKAGMVAYTQCIDLELRPKGIYTYALHPCMSKQTSIGRGALDEVAAEAVGEIRAFLRDFLAAEHDHVSLPADTMVALCVEEGAQRLSGRFVDATHDLEQVLADVAKIDRQEMV